MEIIINDWNLSEKCPECGKDTLDIEGWTIFCSSCGTGFELIGEIKLKSLYFDEDGEVIPEKSKIYVLKLR